MTLYTNGQSVKTIKLGGLARVRFINGDIVTDDLVGELAVLNEKLEVLETFDRQKSLVSSLTGNENYIAYGDWTGTVSYYNRNGGFFPKVSEIIKGAPQADFFFELRIFLDSFWFKMVTCKV